MPPNFDPSQDDDELPPVTTPIDRSQVGAFLGTRSDDAAKKARDRASAIAEQMALQQRIASAPVAANAPPSVVPVVVAPPPPPGTAPVVGVPGVDPAAVSPDVQAGGTPPVGAPPVATGGGAPVAAPAPASAPAAPPAPGAAAPAAPGNVLNDLDKRIDADKDAQLAATRNEAEVTSIGLAKKADAITAQADLQRRQAAELAAQQQYVRDRQDAINKQDSANLQYARDKVIPDFWDGREGAHVGATIGVVLAGIGAGFLGSNTNQAAQIIQHNVDSYYDRKKEEIDNLYKYADKQGLVNDKARAQYAQSITDLLQQHAATLNSAKDRVEAVATESQSDEARARGESLAAQLGSAADKEHLDVANARIKLHDSDDANKAKFMEANAALINARAHQTEAGAAVTRANAAGGVGAGGEDGVPAAGSKVDKTIMTTYVNPARKEANKDRSRVQMLSQLKDALSDPSLTYGQAKQILINGFTAAGGNPGGRIAVADIKEVLPGMQSALGHFMSELDQGIDNKVSPEFRKTVGNAVLPELDRWSKNYNNNGDTFEKNLNLPPAAAKHYRQQIYPGLAAPAAAPAQTPHPQDNDAIAWAKAHQSDPRATQILKANGL